MHDPAEDEPVLPYSPSHTGRRSRVGYLGFDGVGFNELWPLFAGLVLSLGLGLGYFVGGAWRHGHWAAKTAVALAPFAAGFGYLRFLVVGRPPHFKGDLWAAALNLTFDFSDPPSMWFALWPRIRADLAAGAGPAREGGRPHPRRRFGNVKAHPEHGPLVSTRLV